MRWNKSECVFIGFYVEKGFGRQAANSGKPNEILGSNWLWPQILQGAKNGLLDSPIRAVLQRAGLPIIVCMNSYLSKRTTGGTSEPIDEVQFVIRTSDLNLTNMLEGKKIFADLNDSRDLPELMRRIEIWKKRDGIGSTYGLVSNCDTVGMIRENGIQPRFGTMSWNHGCPGCSENAPLHWKLLFWKAMLSFLTRKFTFLTRT